MYKTLEDVERVISLSKPQAVIDMFIGSYLQGQEKETWLDARKVEHEILYPKQLPNPDYVAPLEPRIVNPNYVDGGTEPYWIANPDYVEPVDEFIENVNYIDYETWMQETEEVQIGVKDVLGDDGISVVGTEPVYEDQLVREYAEAVVDVEAWKATSDVYAVRLKTIKNDTLNSLVVTTTAGNTFDADDAARINMLSAIAASSTLGITETFWKLADNSAALVTVDELKEAQALAIQAVGNVVLA